MTLFDGLLDFDDDLPRSADDLDGYANYRLKKKAMS